MNYRNFFYSLIGLLLIITGSANAQKNPMTALESITAAELRDHISFLASDYLNGRVATAPEYEIAAQYVGAQFAAAGLLPAIINEDGNMSYFQGVPFAKTTYSEEIKWSLSINGTVTELVHKQDFKILFGSELNHDDLEMVWVGYGIEEPDHKWNDFKNLDVEGKIIICIGGAPVKKKGKPVLPQDINDKYVGPRGFQSKIGGLFSKGAAGIILIDIDGSTGMHFEEMPSEFTKEKYVYKGGDKNRGMFSFPSIYIAKPEFLETIMIDSKNKPHQLENSFLNSAVEILSEDLILSNNVVGIVPGTDPEMSKEYIVIGAHLDHVKPVQGEVCNGADDNASGSSGVIEIAEAIAMNPFKRTVVFITYTAEEMGLIGSRFFLNSEVFPKEQIKFNINMDMIGRSDPKNEESRAHYVVTNKKYLNQLEAFINQINDGVTDFPLIFDNDQESPGGSDHQSFIGEGIPAFFFFSGLHRDLHRPGDDPDKIDYAKAESISKLAFLITRKLANMGTVPDFLEK